MSNLGSNQIKIKRALKLAEIGKHEASAADMMAAMPTSAIQALTARQLAEMLDAAWSVAQVSKALAIKAAINEGGLWDEERKAFRKLET